MPGQSLSRGGGRRPAGLGNVGRAIVMPGLALVVMIVALLPVAGRTAGASVMAVDAADYVPTVANLPDGYREESVEAVGGDISATLSLRRSFVTLDGSRRVVVDVALGSDENVAQTMMTERVNQLIRFERWQMGPSSAFGEAGFRGTVTASNGAEGGTVLFRIRAVTAEITVISFGGPADLALMDNLARLVQNRIEGDPVAEAPQVGWPETPVNVPGKDPQPIAAVAVGPVGVGPGGVVPPGAEVTGSSSGSPIPGDTIVILAVSGLERPWEAGSGLPRPNQGMEYLTVETQIEVNGATEVEIALSDFWVSTFDGRSWSPLPGRSPTMLSGVVPSGATARGWLTFMIPQDQPALQLTWRLRTVQPLGAQGNLDQTLVVPLTIGASASAQVGAPAPPASVPVVPPGSAPAGPTGPASPSGPSAPTTAPSGPSSPGGGGSGRGGTRLQ